MTGYFAKQPYIQRERDRQTDRQTDTDRQIDIDIDIYSQRF